MVVQKSDQARLQGLVTEAITNLCRNGLNFKSEFSVEGLLGITLDNDDIFLMNIKQTISNDRGTVPGNVYQRDLCDLTSSSSLSCNVSDANFLNVSATLDFSKTGLMCDKADKQDALQLNALDLNIANGSYGKLSDLEMLFDLSTTTGRKRDLLPMDMTCASLLGHDNDVDQLINKSDNPKEEDEMSEASDLVLIKEEHRLHHSDVMHGSISSKNDGPLVLEPSALGTHGSDTMFLNLKADDQLAGCASWEAADGCFDAVPLNLSEPQDPEPQDLSTNQTKQHKSRHVCDFCNKKFRTENGLQRHKDREHPDDLLVTDMPLALIRDPSSSSSQPLDLTIARGDNLVMDGTDLDQDLTISDQEPFTCICSKVVSDYEAYIDHVTNCSKSRLTPCKSCEICGKYFFSNSGYVKHKRLHVGAYKFHCSVCHKGFFDRTHLSAHMDSTHSKVRRYECEFCNKSFFWKHHLKRHKTTCDKAKLVIRNLGGMSETITEEASADSTDKYGMESGMCKTNVLNCQDQMETEEDSPDMVSELLTQSSLVSMTT